MQYCDQNFTFKLLPGKDLCRIVAKTSHFNFYLRKTSAELWLKIYS